MALNSIKRNNQTVFFCLHDININYVLKAVYEKEVIFKIKKTAKCLATKTDKNKTRCI